MWGTNLIRGRDDDLPPWVFFQDLHGDDISRGYRSECVHGMKDEEDTPPTQRYKTARVANSLKEKQDINLLSTFHQNESLPAFIDNPKEI